MKGVLEYQASTGLTLMTTSEKPRVIVELPKPENVFLDYLAHVYNGEPTKLSLADIYRVCEITLGAQVAVDQGKVITV